MQKGNVVLVPFPFTDLTGNKLRPALVLASNEHDVVVAFITSQIHWKEETDLVLKDTPENGLKKTSLVRLSKLITLEKSLLLGLLGTIEYKILNEVNINLKKIFDLS